MHGHRDVSVTNNSIEVADIVLPGGSVRLFDPVSKTLK
jgi:hypothetical protein